MVLDSHWQFWGNGFELKFLCPAKLSIKYEVRIKIFKNSESLSLIFLEVYSGPSTLPVVLLSKVPVKRVQPQSENTKWKTLEINNS